VKSNRTAVLALLMSASMFSLTGCFGSSKVTSPINGVVNQTAPAAPTNVHSSFDAAGNRDHLNWDASASANVASYDVYVYDADPSTGATGTLVANVPVGSTDLPMPLVGSAVSQFYGVRSNGSNGLSSAFSVSGNIVRHPFSGPGGPQVGPNGRPIDPTVE
jgi:hypothetical protein